jgi:nucleoid-associated protein YgaU
MPGPTQRTWTPAKLIVIKPNNGGSEDKLWDFDFPFNPKDFTMTRAAKWEQKSNKGGTLPAEYNGPVAGTIKVEMFLDETDKADGDISKTIKKLIEFVNPETASKGKAKPSAPHIRFIWGTAIEFKGYLESVDVKYSLFRENGNPVRGSATLTMKEFGAPQKKQNPTSGSDATSRSHKVVAGDSLASIAYAEYGNATGWRQVADANPSIHDPMRLLPGASLLIPPA